MKKAVYSTVAALFLMAQTLPAMAAPVVFTVSATVPSATGVTLTTTSILASNPTTRTTITNNQLAMDPMTYNTTAAMWLPDHYFSIDAAATGGSGNADVTITYADTANPNGTGHGLGWKTTMAFAKVVGTTETLITAHGPKKMLKDLNGEHVLGSETAGGFLRMYVGVVSKAADDPATSEAFTNSDKAGTYSGTLTITATAV